MKRALAIARRDCAGFFKSPRGYFFLALAVALWGFYFLNILGRYNFIVARAAGMQIRSEISVPSLHQFVIAPYFQLVLMSFVFLIPLFAMRSFAEERQTGTMELLLTSPGGSFGIVCGKFLALAAIVLTFCAIAGAFPLTLLIWGDPDKGAILSGLAGLLLAGLSFAALSLACGARSERQLSAAVLGVFVLSSLLLLHTAAALLPSRLRYLTELFSAFLQAAQFYDGYLSLQGVLYFLLLSALGLGLASYGIRPGVAGSESRPLKGKGSKIIFPASVMLIATGGILALVQGAWALLSLSHLLIGVVLLLASGILRRGLFTLASPSVLLSLRMLIGVLLFACAVKSELFIDVSDTRQFSLSEHTKAVLRTLPAKVGFRYILRDDLAIDGRAQRLLSTFVSEGPENLSVEIINPADFPSITSTFGMSPEDALQLFSNDFTPPRALKIKEMNESTLSAALLTLTKSEPTKIYFLEEGGAVRLSDTSGRGVSKFAARAEQEGLTPLSLESGSQGIPEDAKVVALIGPREELSSQTLDALGAFLAGGGRLFITLDPPFIGVLRKFLIERGVEAKNELVVDAEQRAFSRGKAGLQPLVHELAEHPVTNRLSGSNSVLMNTAAPVGIPSEPATEYSVRELLFASAGSGAEPDIIPLLTGKRDIASVPGGREEVSLALGAAAESARDGSRLVVYGDSDWLLNSAFEYYSNANLALNSLQWLAGNEWALAERVRTELSASVAVSEKNFSLLMSLTILGVEALALVGLLRMRTLSET